MVGGGSGKLVNFQQHTRKKPEDEKLNLICLIFRYQTTQHKVGVILKHSFAEFWRRFDDFFGNFFLLFSQSFGQQVRVINQSKKLVQYLLSIFRFHGLIFRSHISKNFWYQEKRSSLVYVPTVRYFSSTELSKNFGY